jgi:hypothetical protein
MKTKVSSETFLSNFKKLKSRMRDPLPTDVILFQCENCQTNLPLNSDGVLPVDEPLEQELSIVIDEMLKSLIDTHIKESDKCASSKMHIHPVLGTPKNICLSFPVSDTRYIRDFQLAGDCYKVNCQVTQVNSDYKAIFVLYQNENHSENTYSEFINCNFDNFLNTELPETEDYSEQELIYDDESVSCYQQKLPRMIGGGRKLRADYNYVCLWCPKEDLKKGIRGRYKELKNYRDHFKKYHHGEDGKGVPMSDFLKKLNRCEPTWFCKKCKQHYSLGNHVRHKAICQPEQTLDSSESDSDGEETQHSQIEQRNEPHKKLLAKENDPVAQRQAGFQCQSEHYSINQQASLSTFTKHSNDPIRMKLSKTDDGLYKVAEITDKGESVSRKEKDNDGVQMMQEDVQQMQSKRTILDESISSADEMNNNLKSKQKKKVKFVQFQDVLDELYSSAEEPEEPEVSETELEIKVEALESENTSYQQKENINKWWLKVPKHFYSDRGFGGPKIFLPSDSEEFVKRVSENGKKHFSEKKDLDNKMRMAESGDAQFHQFSLERDQPLVEKYKEFVNSFSAKDVMHIFSSDYEELDIPTGSKSSTAMQYAYRIIEFFKFMANIYRNFHLDWMVDFQCKIEKNHPDGSVSKEIFLPTKTNLTDFIKQFKYGSNPAANCGVRIFALKKLMDFLSQEMKDNEHAFGGDIIENSKKVECLVQKIKNLNMGICPEGTIKHLATASNKSHKRTLIEQLAKCPERTMSSIMKGVSEYVDSDDYLSEKTKLIELACKKTKVPTTREYMNSTSWLLEQLICMGGNRPCALLGITLRDWEERRPGYCPFDQHEDNDMIEEDPEHDKRKILQNPYKKPKGSTSDEPTGVIVKSETDKIAVGPPCYIWFPNALVDLVKDHSLIAQKILPRYVDIYHPKTRLFLNSNGKPIKTIDCKHFKNYIGLPITAYDFRRSLSTFCLDSKVDAVRNAESSVLRHREETGFAYYYQKHSEKIEYVSIQYAMKNGLLKANTDSVDEYCNSLRKNAANDEWELTQKRTDKALEYSQNMIQKRKQSLNEARQKGGRNWILPAEYDSFIEGIEEAMNMEENKSKNGLKPGPFSQLLKYKPGAEGAGAFPPPGIWLIDMYRVLYGLTGNKGDEMRKAELSVYDGIPFSVGLSGRKKIEALRKKTDPSKQDADLIVANYWRDKIKDEAKNRVKGKWLPLRFIFTEKDFDYHKEQVKEKVKVENK